MTVFCFGSINIDNFYQMPHLPQPGETLAATGYACGLGGKGANQSVASARAGSVTKHIGAVGDDGAWCLDKLRDMGVDTAQIATTTTATGHANVCVDPSGENMIVLAPGANHAQNLERTQRALRGADPGDILLLQNEVNLVKEVATLAKNLGLFVIYSAAPFDANAAQEVLPLCDLLVVNEVEAQQLSEALGVSVNEIEVPAVLITRGAKGAVWRDQITKSETKAPAFKVTPVDTTGAGDCFIGYVAAGLDQGLLVADALRLASAASALQVTRPGTADAIPMRADVDAFLAGVSP
ncbi:ribokinase [Aliiroseovarius lamellibrachiae]|uniref:ribokinase n=1 Tax=Aliiroseovarius lamellibrachiae TaxID=1924933 RepID=UPI001BE0011A|nr:ribokinase [Aliiroseovarius lamellibrachiae]MBT2131824.1 ribokinase [Aliiroseovarius lamellibrachiae]